MLVLKAFRKLRKHFFFLITGEQGLFGPENENESFTFV